MIELQRTVNQHQFTKQEMVKELRIMASQILTPSSRGKALYTAIANELENSVSINQIDVAITEFVHKDWSQETSALIGRGDAHLFWRGKLSEWMQQNIERI